MSSRPLGVRLLLGAAALLWLLHWPHLSADFPNFSPWMDYSKYTDEGWYGKAAISAILTGHWFVPGDLNTAVAMPVWPLLEWCVFLCTGVSVEAARGLALCVFGGNLVLAWAVLRAARVSPLSAAFGVLLLSGSMFLWAFSRLAILEPLETFWLLSAWLVALRIAPSATSRIRPTRRQAAALLSVGLYCCLAILTKTTALFTLPSVALLVCAAANWRPVRAAAWCGLALLGGLLPWLVEYLLVTHRYAADFHYFFTVNHWQQPHGLGGHLLAYWWAAHGLLWLGPWLVCIVLALLIAAPFLLPGLWRQPLVLASICAAAGVTGFMGWHNSPQPRYCMVVAYPLVFAAVCALDLLWRRRRALGAVVLLALCAVLGQGIYGSVRFALHPEYTMRNAAEGITAYIDAHRNEGRPLLLSISADEITLYTHLPGICDDFGTLFLTDRIERYRPGWYAAWNELDDGTVEDIQEAGYRLQPVAHWAAFDDDDRDDLVLYRMVPLAEGSQAAAPTRESAAP